MKYFLYQFGWRPSHYDVNSQSRREFRSLTGGDLTCQTSLAEQLRRIIKSEILFQLSTFQELSAMISELLELDGRSHRFPLKGRNAVVPDGHSAIRRKWVLRPGKLDV
jgi:hypothetical protein